MSQIDTIYSAFDQLTTWEQYRDLLIETLTASGYQNLDDIIRSEFTENHFDNPELLAQFIVPLFSPHPNVANVLYSGTDPLHLLVRVNRSRELIVNGTFDTDLTGWTDASTAPSTIEWSDGKAVSVIDGSNPARLRQTVVTETQGLYQISSTDTMPIRVGTVASGEQMLLDAANATRTFIAPGTTAWVSVFTTTDGQELDNVSLRRID